MTCTEINSPDAAGRGRAGIGGRLDGADVSAGHHRHVSGPDVLLGDQLDVRGLHHRVSRFDGADEATGFDESQGVSHEIERTLACCSRGRNGLPLCVCRVAGPWPIGQSLRFEEFRGVKPLAACVVVTMALSAVVGCKKKDDTQPPVATATFAASRAKAPLGSPLELTYRFVVAANAPAFDKDYRVLVHFLDSDDQLMWTDDHSPAISTREWKPGQRIEYSRHDVRAAVPVHGPGHHPHRPLRPRDRDAGCRWGARTTGSARTRRATLELLPASDSVFVQFKDGWHNAEVAAENAQVEWQWTKKIATLALRNPRRDATFYLHFDGRPDLVPGQTLTVRIGDQVLDTYALTSNEEVIRRIAITTAQFGERENVDLTIEVNQAFVPAQTPAAKSSDPRELGIRVFHAFIEPK